MCTRSKTFKLKLQTNPQAIASVTQSLIQNGFELYECRKLQTSLEEVFLNLTMEAEEMEDFEDDSEAQS